MPRRPGHPERRPLMERPVGPRGVGQLRHPCPDPLGGVPVCPEVVRAAQVVVVEPRRARRGRVDSGRDLLVLGHAPSAEQLAISLTQRTGITTPAARRPAPGGRRPAAASLASMATSRVSSAGLPGDPDPGGTGARRLPRPPARRARRDRRGHAALDGRDHRAAGDREAAAPGVLLLGLARRGRRGLPADLRRGRGARAAARERARARRPHGRQRHPARPAVGAPQVRRRARRGRVARVGGRVRRRGGDPHRGSPDGLDRSAVRRAAGCRPPRCAAGSRCSTPCGPS